MKKPIIYEDLVDVRFSDLDHYNHVNSKHYLDIISTSRLTFLAREMKMPIEKVTERGIGFYMSKAITNFKRPVVGLQKIRASSYISEVVNNKKLIIPFELKSEDSTVTFADGILEFAVIDMKTGRPTETPEWVLDLFFK